MAELVYFPTWFFQALILSSLALAALGATTLLVLLVRDILRKSIW